MTTLKGLKLIGKGTFTKCYLNTDGETVTLLSKDPIKECMSLGWFPDSKLFPKIQRVDCSDDGETQVYTMEHFPRTKGLKPHLKPSQWEIYKLLKSIADSVGFMHNNYDRYDALYAKFSEIGCDDLRDTMIEALEGCSNIGCDIGFEVSPRNVAVKDGDLVLLDVFYHIGTLRKVRGF